MTLLSTAYRYNKMSLQAEEVSLKAHRELLRLGCHHGEIEVLQEGSNLRLAYNDSIMTMNAFEALATLKGLRRPVQAKDIWAILNMANRNNLGQQNSYSKHVLTATVILIMVFTIIVMLK